MAWHHAAQYVEFDGLGNIEVNDKFYSLMITNSIIRDLTVEELGISISYNLITYGFSDLANHQPTTQNRYTGESGYRLSFC